MAWRRPGVQFPYAPQPAYRTSVLQQCPVDYPEDVDSFGIYCDEHGSVFIVPVGAVPLRGGQLRVSPPRNNQQRNIRWAEQFRLEWSPPALDTRPVAGGEPGDVADGLRQRPAEY